MPKNKTIYIGTDHRGFKLKEKLLPQLNDLGYKVVDCGAEKYDEKDDYVDYAFKVTEKVVKDDGSKGLLFCGSGLGMGIASNKVQGIIASQAASLEAAVEDRIEHNSNVLIIAADDIKRPKSLVKILDAWLKADFAKGRHLRRINKIRFFERTQHLQYPMKPLVVPTILTGSKREAKKQYAALRDELPLLNFDIIDPTFIKGKTIGFADVISYLHQAYNEKPKLFFSVHLMVRKPKAMLKQLNNMPNVYTVYIHHEADVEGLAEMEWSFQLGVTLNPDTQVSDTDYFQYPIVQLMTVKPGAQGKKLEKAVFDKVEELRKNGFVGEIHFDGGVNQKTFKQFLETKPDVLNVGSAIMKKRNIVKAYHTLAQQIAIYAKNH